MGAYPNATRVKDQKFFRVEDKVLTGRWRGQKGLSLRGLIKIKTCQRVKAAACTLPSQRDALLIVALHPSQIRLP